MATKSPAKPPTEIKDEKRKDDAGPPSQQTQNKDNKRQDNRNHGHGGRGRGGGFGGRGGRRGGGGGGGYNHDQNRQNQGPGQRQHQYQQSFNKQDMDDTPQKKIDKKFTGRCRLFVGNVTPDITEAEFKEMFSPYGETGEAFVNGSKGFGFIRLDYRHNAEAAKAALDGTTRKGRTLRVRFANHGAAIKVKNLSPYVTNELLEQAFQQFGEIERAIVIADDRGRSTGEGLVEFARKPGATQALKRIGEGIFLMSAYPRPVAVEPMEIKDDDDGLSEKFLPRNEQVRKDRENEPRFAPPGSFEYTFALKYREIDDMEKQKVERVKQEMDQQRLKLEAEMESAMFDYQAEQIRQDLVRRQEELKRLEEMKSEQLRRRQELDIMRDEEQRMMRDEEDRRREMMMRGGAPNRGNDQPGAGMRGDNQRGSRGGNPPLPPPPAPPAAMGFDKPNDMPGNSLGGSGSGYGGGMPQGGIGNSGSMGGGNSMGSDSQMSRYDSQGGNYGVGSGNYGGRSGQGSMGGGNMPGQGGIFGNRGMGGGMGNRQGLPMDRRREPGPRDDYGEMKRMRRY